MAYDCDYGVVYYQKIAMYERFSFILHGNISELCPFMLKLRQNLCNIESMYDI